MSATTGVPLKTYDPDWERRWERATEVFRHWRRIASASGRSTDEHYRAVEWMENAGAVLQESYTAQFRTVEAYRDWRLKWLWHARAWPWLNIPPMPDGLTVTEVRRRLDEAEKYLRALKLLFSHGPRADHIRRLHKILASPADPATILCADIARSFGGDDV
jgi:hypothetical protein